MLPDTYAAVDALATEFQRMGGQPGLAYGVVAGGHLVHAHGLGERQAGGSAPDERTVFRIASMTKSFTAAAVLALRDDGALALDDPAGAYVPELRGVRAATGDSPPVSIRHLLTMTAGFPTDDPWGDRQQGLPLPEFAALLRDGGVRFAWAPGTRFDYSNLGYAILGALISSVSGIPYPEFVRQRLLGPLAMTRTGFEAADFAPGELARGYRRDGSDWAELVPDPCGAFAAMGGLFSCVADLARWVTGFAAAYPPGAGDSASGPHPLPREVRREMQLPQVALPLPRLARFPGDPDATGPVSYGMGLFAEDHPAWGAVVQHSGGYPGFGSHMRWHPATGLGVVVLANSTYAGAPVLGSRLLDALLGQLPAQPDAGTAPRVSGPAPAPGGPWPETVAARQAITGLLRSWDDAAATRLFAENVAQDEPLPQRRRDAELLRERIGEFGEDPGRPADHDSPAHCRWWLRGAGGVTAAEIRLTPEQPPRVQSLSLAIPPAAGSALALALETLIGTLNDGARSWPASLPVAGSLDTGSLLRRLRMAAASAGPCRLAAFRSGNGDSAVVAELDGATARLALDLTIDPAGPLLRQADVLLIAARG